MKLECSVVRDLYVLYKEKDRLKAILNLEDADIEFRDYMEKEARLNGKCTFDIKKGSSLRLKTWESTITIPAIQI